MFQPIQGTSSPTAKRQFQSVEHQAHIGDHQQSDIRFMLCLGKSLYEFHQTIKGTQKLIPPNLPNFLEVYPLYHHHIWPYSNVVQTTTYQPPKHPGERHFIARITSCVLIVFQKSLQIQIDPMENPVNPCKSHSFHRKIHKIKVPTKRKKTMKPAHGL